MYWGRKESTTEIAEKYGVSEETIRKWLIKLGIPRRTRNEANRVMAIRKRWRKKFFVDWWKEPTWNLGYVVGAVIGDGTLTKYGFKITSTCKGWLQNVSKIILYWCGWYPIFKERQAKVRYMTKSKGLVEKTVTIYEIGLWSVDVAKFIEEVIENISKYIRFDAFFKGFISGLIDSDGTVFFGEYNRYRCEFKKGRKYCYKAKNRIRYVAIYNTNINLIRMVKRKLREYGITSKVLMNDKSRKRAEYILCLSNKKSLLLLYKIVSLLHPKKRENLNKIMASYKL